MGHNEGSSKKQVQSTNAYKTTWRGIIQEPNSTPKSSRTRRHIQDIRNVLSSFSGLVTSARASIHSQGTIAAGRKQPSGQYLCFLGFLSNISSNY